MDLSAFFRTYLLSTKFESDNIISDHIEYIHQTLRFTFVIKLASMFQQFKLVDVLAN